MGNLLPSLGRRKLPMLEMPKVGGKTGGGVPVGSVAYLPPAVAAVDPTLIECNGQVVKITSPQFPLQPLADGTVVRTVQGVTANFNAGARFYSIAYGKGIYVAVGSNGGGQTGGIWASADAINWSLVNTWVNGSTSAPTQVVFANGVFVAVGAGLKYSADGTNWSGMLNTSINFQAVRFLNGQFVFLGRAGTQVQRIYTSVDGFTLTSPSTIGNTGDTAYAAYDIAYLRGRYYAAGVLSGNDGQLWISNDLISWNAGGFTNYGSGYFWGVGGNDNVIVAAGSNKIIRSTDGINFIAQNSVGSEIYSVSANDDYILAVNASGACYSSPDGINWFFYGGYTQNIYPGTEPLIASGGAFLFGSADGNAAQPSIMSVSVGKSLYQTPVIATQSLRAGGTAKAYIKVAP